MPLLLFLIAALVAAVLGPTVRRLAGRMAAEDRPGVARKIHLRTMPRLGGLTMGAGTAIAIVAAVVLGTPAGERILDVPRPILGLGGAALVIGLVGLVDDIVELSPWITLAGQIVSSLAMWFAGFRIEALDLGFGYTHLGAFALPVTMLWFLAAMNAVNLVDGLDGLAATLALLGIAVLVVQAAGSNGPVARTVASALAGALTGFLIYNLHPARQFMGSCGSYLLGLLLAGLAVGTLRGRAGINPVVPLLALGVPLFDLVLAFVRRVARGRSPLRGDREHLHHRALDRGLTHGRAVLALAAWQAVNSALAIAALYLPGRWTLAPLAAAAVVAAAALAWLRRPARPAVP